LLSEVGFFINLHNCSEIIGEQGKKPHSFSIGLDADAPDAAATARKVADFLATLDTKNKFIFLVTEGVKF
jgi:asparagine synthase (glutamine-hydrolysing)